MRWMVTLRKKIVWRFYLPMNKSRFVLKTLKLTQKSNYVILITIYWLKRTSLKPQFGVLETTNCYGF